MRYLITMILISTSAWASTPDEDARAAIAIASAFVDLGELQPDLPRSSGDVPSVTEEPPPIQRETQDASETGPTDGARPDSVSDVKIVESAPPVTKPGPMMLTFDKVMEASSPIVVDTYVPTGDWCVFCNQFKKNNGNGDDRFSIVYHTEKPEQVLKLLSGRWVMVDPDYPVTFWTNDAGKKIYLEGYYTKDQIWEKLSKPENVPMQAVHSGGNGSVNAYSAVQSVKEFFRSKIGEGKKATFLMDRTGQQQLNLLHATDWKATDMFGQFGRIVLSAENPINLPIDRFAFTYEFVKGGMKFRPDEIFIPGLDEILSVKKVQGTYGDVYGIIGIDDIFLASSILGVVRTVFELFWPGIDAMIPARLEANAVLVGDKLTVDFPSGPSVRIRSLFTFTLKVTKAEITDTNVRVHFSGSRMIQYKDFSITR